VRFDTLTELRQRYRTELNELSWGNIYDRPDLQVRAMVLLTRQNYHRLIGVKDEYQQWSMINLAYNGGVGAVQKARQACGLARNCDPGIYWGHTERYNPKSTKPLYGNRSAKMINQEHTVKVIRHELPRFNTLYTQ